MAPASQPPHAMPAPLHSSRAVIRRDACDAGNSSRTAQLRETLLGGVSRDLLDHMTVPVLMSH